MIDETGDDNDIWAFVNEALKEAFVLDKEAFGVDKEEFVVDEIIDANALFSIRSGIRYNGFSDWTTGIRYNGFSDWTKVIFYVIVVFFL